MKYIVYCTVNTTNNHIYVGVHETQNPYKYDFYLGDNCYANDCNTYTHPKTKFQHAVKTFGPKVFRRLILAVFDNPIDAYLVEEMIINKEFLSRPDVYNTVLGGRELNHIDNIIYSYDLDGNYLNEYYSLEDASRKTKLDNKAIWNAVKNKLKCGNCYWTDIKYEKLDLTYYKVIGPSEECSIYQYDENGNYECTYASISVASKLLNIPKSSLVKAIKLGIKNANKYFTDVYAPEFCRAKGEKLKVTKVHQYSLKGEFIKTWDSAYKAQKELSIKDDLHRAIKLGHVAGGYQWSHEKLDKMPILEREIIARRVGKYTIDNELVKEYKTITECKKENGSAIVHVLSGRNKTHKGYIYKYLS